LNLSRVAATNVSTTNVSTTRKASEKNKEPNKEANTGVELLANQILAGNRRSLSRAITLVESTRPDHRQQADSLLQRLSPHAGGSIRIGLSGIPGVGKSTFIESLGLHILEQNYKLAVLAVDPSSVITGGSIMADKTRMEDLSRHQNVFIRPSPSGCTLGGVTRRTRETLLLCEAAGFDVIIVETVGVGQSETAVADMTDLFLLLLLPGAGDELQGIKRGIMELADIVIVNKADGDMAIAANHTASDYLSALRLLQPRTKNWVIPVKTCSALNAIGIAESWQLIEKYKQLVTKSGELSNRRSQQAKVWLWSELIENLKMALYENTTIRNSIDKIEAEVISGRVPATMAASQLVSAFLKSK
jgi:LAO/AO transport system kinase